MRMANESQHDEITPLVCCYCKGIEEVMNDFLYKAFPSAAATFQCAQIDPMQELSAH